MAAPVDITIVLPLFTYIHFLQLNSLIIKSGRAAGPVVLTSVGSDVQDDDDKNKPKKSTPGTKITRTYGQLRICAQ